MLTCVLSACSVFGQTVIVKKEKSRIRNEYGDGYEVTLDGTAEEINSALTRLMKTFGKTKSAENYVSVAEPTIAGKPYTAPLYGVSKQVGNIQSVWLGIVTKDWSRDDAETAGKELERIVKDFGVTFHRDKIQKQIDESVRASQAVERQLQRLANQNRDLNSKIEDNKREKIQLEKALENNKLELENLTKRLEKNEKDRDSVAVAGDQIKKVIDMHRERQRSVN